MSNPKSNESEDLLYKCDNSYIKQLNIIRRQLNFIEINDDEEREENDNTEDNCHQNFEITNTPLPESSFNPELYSCDDRDLKRLNAIRKELNLVEIDSLNKSVARNGESVSQIPEVCIFKGQSTKTADSHHRKKEKRKHKHKHHRTTKKEKVVEVLYSPPAKRMCFRESPEDLEMVHEETPTSLQQFLQEEETLHNQNTESDIYTTDFSISSPSEKSSPVKNLAYTPNSGAISSPVSQKTHSASHSTADESNFCSLNVPIYDEKPSPSLSVVSEEEPESMKVFSLFENRNLMMSMTNSCSSRNILSGPISSLELPKLSKDLYDFPILANIYQWSDIFAKRAVKSLELQPRPNEIKRYSRAKSLESVKHERPQMKSKEDVDVDGIGTLSKMFGWRERLGFDFYLNSFLWMTNRVSPLHDTQETHQETEEQANSVEEDRNKTGKKTCGCFGQCFGMKRKKFFK